MIGVVNKIEREKKIAEVKSLLIHSGTGERTGLEAGDVILFELEKIDAEKEKIISISITRNDTPIYWSNNNSFFKAITLETVSKISFCLNMVNIIADLSGLKSSDYCREENKYISWALTSVD